MKIRFDRLELLASVLEVADKVHQERGELPYEQGHVSYHCGAPACALGHYAAANAWRGWRTNGGMINMGHGFVDWDSALMRREFGLTVSQHDELFSSEGCGKAKTAKQAARYIRKFVNHKQHEAKK